MVTDIIERDVTIEELETMRNGFAANDESLGFSVCPQQRHGFVAMQGERFVGCSSGLTDRNWFYLSDLWVAEDRRGQCLGGKLLANLEKRSLRYAFATSTLGQLEQMHWGFTLKTDIPCLPSSKTGVYPTTADSVCERT